MVQKPTFTGFSTQVRANFSHMNSFTDADIYEVEIDKDELWAFYLNAFPEGTNEVYRTRREYDCGCCRNFVRNLGAVVRINTDLSVSTVWDVPEVGFPFNDVAMKMSQLISSLPIKNVYRSEVAKHGQEVSHERQIEGEKVTVIDWNHFYSEVPHQRVLGQGVASYLAQTESAHHVALRGLSEITLDALTQIENLIRDESIYRGNEHAEKVSQFIVFKRAYDSAGNNKQNFVWRHVHDSSARFRNSVIGTLAVDISDGMDIEKAVELFEKKVAPSNYKRSKSVITERMINNAMAKVEELGLRSALERRHAVTSDLSVNDVLFVDQSSRDLMRDSLTDSLMAETPSNIPKTVFDNAIDIPIDQFIQEVLPTAIKMQLVAASENRSNLMSLTSPVDPDSKHLFKWQNNCSWSYAGDKTDGIKERVKDAGGNVDAVMRISLSWSNHDDLDIHVVEPDGNHIHFGNKSNKLDVDMNAGSLTRKPVENISWAKGQRLLDGKYRVVVHNYNKREESEGFQVQLENNGKTTTFSSIRALGNKEKIQCFTLLVVDGVASISEANPSMHAEHSNEDLWGLKSDSLVDISTIVLSPNHWYGVGAGNKHWFFIAEGCLNPEPVRSVYNEFLSQDPTLTEKFLKC